jgi:simple sugar transport system permease protein
MDLDALFVQDWAAASIRLATPLILAAVGGVYSERSGVYNIGIEGMMVTGAFVAVVFSFLTQSATIGAMASLGAGILMALVHAYFVVTRMADQILVGVGLNLLAFGGTNFLYRQSFGEAGRERVAGFLDVKLPILGDIPLIGAVLFNQNAGVYLAYVLPVVATFLLYRSTWGLSVRAVGEHPLASEAAGLSVRGIRYCCVMFSGAMAGLGGAVLSLGASRYFTPNMTAGRGFVVLGAIVLGKWNPTLAAIGCLVFGMGDALQLRAQTFGFAVPHQFFIMLPYLVTIAAMIGVVGRSTPPAHLGRPYTSESA